VSPVDRLSPFDDEYLRSVLRTYEVPATSLGRLDVPAAFLSAEIEGWAADSLREISRSGSFAKGTAIRGGTDLDLFLSFHPLRTGTLEEIYNDVFDLLQREGYTARRQNVSIGVQLNGLKIDLVPGRQIRGTEHNLWVRKQHTWIKTDITQHIRTVQSSGLLDEIRLMKVWRRAHDLEFPSFCLELAVLRALQLRNRNQLAQNMIHVFRFLSGSFADVNLVDPANSNNVVSDDLSREEKGAIARSAEHSLGKSSWHQVLV